LRNIFITAIIQLTVCNVLAQQAVTIQFLNAKNKLQVALTLQGAITLPIHQVLKTALL
jgi:hypothetical protein